MRIWDGWVVVKFCYDKNPVVKSDLDFEEGFVNEKDKLNRARSKGPYPKTVIKKSRL